MTESPAPTPDPAPIASPCVGRCGLDAERRHCIGCTRTLDEIVNWSKMTSDQRSAIMRILPDRRAALAAPTPGPGQD